MPETVHTTTIKEPSSDKPAIWQEARSLFWLNHAHHTVRTEIVRRFRDAGHDITAEQWSVMNVLWQHGDASQTSISKRTGRDRPAMTRLVASLEKKGLVVREAVDRRTNNVRLTDAGRELHDLLGPVFSDIVNLIQTEISPKEMEITARTLQAITLMLKGRDQG